jgi:hypothetical protein
LDPAGDRYAFTGKQAGFILSKSDVHLEPLNLANCYPTSRPGDLLQIDLVPTYVSSPLSPFAKAAVDVRVTNSFLLNLLVIPPIRFPSPNTFRKQNKQSFVAQASALPVLL